MAETEQLLERWKRRQAERDTLIAASHAQGEELPPVGGPPIADPIVAAVPIVGTDSVSTVHASGKSVIMTRDAFAAIVASGQARALSLEQEAAPQTIEALDEMTEAHATAEDVAADPFVAAVMDSYRVVVDEVMQERSEDYASDHDRQLGEADADMPHLAPPADEDPRDAALVRMRDSMNVATAALEALTTERKAVLDVMGLRHDVNLVDEVDKMNKENHALRTRLGFRPKRGALGRR